MKTIGIALLVSCALISFSSQLLAAPEERLVAPESIKLNGLERRSSLSSPLGRIELRWNRETERLFGNTPERATIEAANAVFKALKQSSFPSKIKNLNQDWQIVFLSKNLKSGQVPQHLLDNCHPGWMVPPANIYIAPEQVAGACGSVPAQPGKIADNKLAQVMIHEMGHAVEYALAPNVSFERARSEGFASWFEVFSGRFSSLLNVNSIIAEQKHLARQKLMSREMAFTGSAADYALAAIFFHILSDGKGVADISRMYALLESNPLPYTSAIAQTRNWTHKQLSEKISAYITK